MSETEALKEIFTRLNAIAIDVAAIKARNEEKAKNCSDHNQELKDIRTDMTIQSKQFYVEIEKIVLAFDSRLMEQGRRVGEVEKLTETTIATYKAEKQTRAEVKEETRKMFTSWHEWLMLAVMVGSAVGWLKAVAH